MKYLEQLTTAIDYAAPATQLPYIDCLEIFKDCGSKSLIIKAECGTGKTHSLKPLKDSGKKVLYVSHRIALNEENKEYFTDTTCINSLGAYKVNEYDFIIFDEWTAKSSGFDWDVLNLDLIDTAIKNYRGNLIFIDRDCNEASIEHIKEFTGRNDFAYHHHVTGSRNKVVLFTEDINELIEQANKCYGIKIICTDSKKKAEWFAKQPLGIPAKAITGGKSESVARVLDWAHEQKNCIIFCSPKVQEGTSFVGPEFVFNGYIFYGTKGIKLPANKIYQASQRCRNSATVRAVCFQNNYIEPQPELDARELYADYLEKIGKLKEAFVAEQNGWRYKHRKVFYSLYCDYVIKTNSQLSDIIAATRQEFEDGGYSVDISRSKPNKKLKLNTAERVKIKKTDYEVSHATAVWLKMLENMGLGCAVSQILCTQAQQIVKPEPDTATTNNVDIFAASDEDYYQTINNTLLLHAVYKPRQRWFMDKQFERFVNVDNMFDVNDNKLEQIESYFNTLVELGDTFEYVLGYDIEFTKSSLEASCNFAEFKRWSKNGDANNNQFFTTFGKRLLGLDFRLEGNSKDRKYVMTNNIGRIFTDMEILNQIADYQAQKLFLRSKDEYFLLYGRQKHLVGATFNA